LRLAAAIIIFKNVNDESQLDPRNGQLIHIFLPLWGIQLTVGAMTKRGQGARAMADMLDFREEAKWCLNLAEAETHPEVRTLLMGMVVGWLSLANHLKSPAVIQHAPMEDA
jgi:hypothetical protein